MVKKLLIFKISYKKTNIVFLFIVNLHSRLRWQREVGLMSREANRWFPQKPKCENKVAGFVSIGLSESRYPFEIFLAGTALSIILLLLEKMWYQFYTSCVAARRSQQNPMNLK